jgi:hypothetical protein
LGCEPEAHGVCAGLGSRAHVKLAEDGSDVMVDGPRGEHKPTGVLRVA